MLNGIIVSSDAYLSSGTGPSMYSSLRYGFASHTGVSIDILKEE